jgi:hypothetical protein
MAKSNTQADAAYKAMQTKVAPAKKAAAAEGRGGWNKPAGGKK